MEKDRGRTLGFLALLGSTLIWGSSFVVTKELEDALSPCWLTAARMALAAAALALFFGRRLWGMPRRAVLRGTLLGMLYSGGIALQNYGLFLTTPGKSAFLTAAYCVMVPFLAWAVTKKRPEVHNLLAGVVCMTGIGLVSLDSDFRIQPGDLVTLLCAAFFAVHLVLSGVLVRDTDVIALNLVQFAAGAAFMTALGLALEPLPALNGGSGALALGYLGVVCTALPLLGMTYSLRFLSPAAVSILLCFEAVFAALFSVLFYHETFTARALAGFALIFAAAVVSEWHPARRR